MGELPENRERIWYYFEQPHPPDESKLLVLVDTNERALGAELGAELPLQVDHASSAFRQAVTAFAQAHELAPTSLAPYSSSFER